MGMFSFICPKCNRAITSHHGSPFRNCIIFLKEGGNVIETQVGAYDGYGRCEGEWDAGWDKCCSLVESESREDGFLYFHTTCHLLGDETRFKTSERDPNQGLTEPAGTRRTIN